MKKRGRTGRDPVRARPAQQRPRNEKARHPQKQFGQHFLRDRNIINKIVGAADIQPGDLVLEIGPGTGHLTRALAVAGARVVAVEIDKALADQLALEASQTASISVLQGDFLSSLPRVWLEKAGLNFDRYKVVANLPYYVTSAILRHLLEANERPTDIVVMVQREVAQQITARPGRMSLLAASVQFYGQPKVVSTVPAGAFYPRPRVDSAIVQIKVNPSSSWPEVKAARFFALARAGFSERRKQLRNSLAGGLGISSAEASQALTSAGIDPTRRAESLSLEEWRRLYEQFFTDR